MINEQVAFEKSEEVRIEIDPIVRDSEKLSFNSISVSSQFEAGDEIQVDFDHVRLMIAAIYDDHYTAVVMESGKIGSNKASDLNRDLRFDPLTEKDRRAIEIASKMASEILPCRLPITLKMWR